MFLWAFLPLRTAKSEEPFGRRPLFRFEDLGMSSAFLASFAFAFGRRFMSRAARVPKRSEERHQWLELTLRPSLQSFVCDLWVADAVGFEALRWPIAEARIVASFRLVCFGLRVSGFGVPAWGARRAGVGSLGVTKSDPEVLFGAGDVRFW